MSIRRSIGSLRKGARRELQFLYGRSWGMRSFGKAEDARRAVSYLQQHQDKLLFITGMGRSGTQLISSLLDRTALTKVYHEPNFSEDVATMEEMRRYPDRADKYWNQFRSLEVYKRWLSEPEKPFYGEVNGTIRYQVPAIKKLYPQAKLMLMVRDGRGVVRSIMGWPQFYSRGSKGAYALAPLPGDPFGGEWDRMSRFEKICWSWRETHEFLIGCIPETHRLKLERITSDYSYFEEHFIKNIGVHISYEMWLSVVSVRSKNATSSYRFPHWDDWGRERKVTFKRICGETMGKLGYEI